MLSSNGKEMPVKIRLLMMMCLCTLASAVDLDPVDWWQRDRVPASYLALERLADRNGLDLDLTFAPVDQEIVAEKLGALSVTDPGDEQALAMARNFVDQSLIDDTEKPLHPRVYHSDDVDLSWQGGLRGLGDYRNWSGVQPVQDFDWLARAYLGASLKVGSFSGNWAVVAERLDDETTMSLTSTTLPWQSDLTKFYGGGKPWGSLMGDITTAVIQYQGDWLRVWLGRRFLLWGQGDWGRTLISTYAGPLDGMGADFKLAQVHLGWAMGILDPGLEKYISLHRLAWRPFPGWEVAVSESVIWAQRGLDFVYLNPAIPYYVAQWNRGDVDNLQVGFDSSLAIWRDLTIYGELLIDDWQYKPEHDAPDKIASLAGMRWHDPLGISATRLGLEYSRVNRWTYTHKYFRNRYVHNEMPLGSPLGNDSDRLVLTFDRFMSIPWGGTALPGIMVSYTRRGDDDLLTPWELGEKGRGIPFPTPPVEQELGAFAKCEFYNLAGLVGGFGRVGWRSYLNHARVPGETSHGLEVSIGLNAGI
jgi:hypothetical protein